jgi:hypothetical protein
MYQKESDTRMEGCMATIVMRRSAERKEIWAGERGAANAIPS